MTTWRCILLKRCHLNLPVSSFFFTTDILMISMTGINVGWTVVSSPKENLPDTTTVRRIYYQQWKDNSFLAIQKYSRLFSMHFFAFTSEFYRRLLSQSLSVRTRSFCSEQNGQSHLCLPDFARENSIDFLFWYTGMETKLPVIRGWFGLTSTTMWLFTHQIECDSRIPDKLAWMLKSVSVLAYRLYWNGFFASSEHFPQGVDHLYFYGLLKNYPSYRNENHKLCSFYRYRNFARTYTYPSGRVKFSRVHAAFFGTISNHRKEIAI